MCVCVSPLFGSNLAMSVKDHRLPAWHSFSSQQKPILPILCQVQRKIDSMWRSLVIGRELRPSVADWEHLLNKEGMRAEPCDYPTPTPRGASALINHPNQHCKLRSHPNLDVCNILQRRPISFLKILHRTEIYLFCTSSSSPPKYIDAD